MATMAMQQPRRRKATYGKTARTSNSWNFADLDSLDDDELTAPALPMSRAPIAKSSAPARQPEMQPSKLKPVRSKAQQEKKDAFEVSSSESSDVDELSPAKKRSPPRFARKVQAKTFQQPEVELAPWEKRRVNVTKPTDRLETTRESDDGAGMVELDASVQMSGSATVTSPASAVKTSLGRNAEATASRMSSPKVMSAAERLRARRLQSEQSTDNSKEVKVSPAPRSQKRAGPDDGRPELSRKRTKSGKQENDTQDVVMADVKDSPDCTSSNRCAIDLKQRDKDVFEFLGSSADETVTRKPQATERNKHRQISRRGKLTTYSSPRKMESAPARLSEMLATDTDTHTQSTSDSTSRAATPRRAEDGYLSPAMKTSSKPGTDMTPQQTQVRNRLLPKETAFQSSPSLLHMEDLKLSSTRRSTKPFTAASRMIIKSSSDVGRQQPRLVDRLKASARSSSEESSDDSEDDDDARSDGDMVVDRREQASQPQSQVTSQNTGPKITYAQRVRSYLPEDSFEDDLMMELPTQTPQRPAPLSRRTTGKSASSQNSAFDMDDSEDEGTSGRLRTIHELRAGGGHQRFVNDIGSLLDDIADHNYSARSRRRSAMIEIATKLPEKGVAQRFFRQGYEQRLLSECGAAPDDVADYALVTSMAVMLGDESPDHAPQTFKDGGVLPWLIRLLSEETDPRKLARERKNNMSKAAILTFSDFVAALPKNESLWGEDRPSVVTTRTIALKALDLLVAKLRRAGDRSELLNTSELDVVIFHHFELDALTINHVPTNLTLSVSILESLSTASLSLDWPVSVITLLRELLSIAPPPDTTSSETSSRNRQHLHFLTLRLCLNLTNDNSRNVRLFSEESPSTIHALLSSISSRFIHLAATAPLPQPSSPTLTFTSDLDLTLPSPLLPDQTQDNATLDLDLLLLTMGITINLTTSSSPSRLHALRPDTIPLLQSLIATFRANHTATSHASSLASGLSNVAFGYLSVVLANFCLEPGVRTVVAEGMEGGKLTALVGSVEEFVRFHQRVDRDAQMLQQGGGLNSALAAASSSLTNGGGGGGGRQTENRMMGDGGKEEEGEHGGRDGAGGELWEVFTERLKDVLGRLKDGAEEDGLL